MVVLNNHAYTPIGVFCLSAFYQSHALLSLLVTPVTEKCVKVYILLQFNAKVVYITRQLAEIMERERTHSSKDTQMKFVFPTVVIPIGYFSLGLRMVSLCCSCVI